MTAEETMARMQIVSSQPPTTEIETAFSANDNKTGTSINDENVNANANVVTGIAASTKASIVTAPIELTENFYINNRKKNNVKIQVKLSGSGIYLRRETEQRNNINEQLLRIEDIVGSRFGSRLKKRVRGGLNSCKRNVQTPENEEEGEQETGIGHQQKDTSAYLYIYAYLKPEKPGSPRHRTVRILRFRSYERFEENLKSAENWYRAIRVNKSLTTCGTMADVVAVEQQPKPLLILLNPKSGSGKSRELFQKQVVPVLKEAEMHYELQITTHANYARDLVRRRKDLETSYSGIVVASGDGLFYEVLNGLMERTDWRSVCNKLPIGIIPCGSGNGLAKSIAHLYNEPYEPKPVMHATLTCVSGHTAPMDIVRVELATRPNAKPVEMYSFLSIGWGLIADIDIESERLRSIGAQRFTLWTIHRLISLRTYKGKLSYLPWVRRNNDSKDLAKQPQSKLHLEKAAPSNEENADEPKSSKSHEVENGFYDALGPDDDFFADAASLDGVSFRTHMDSWHSAASKRTAYYSLAGQSIRSRRSLTASILSKLETARAPAPPPPPAATIPPLNMPLPEDSWTSEDGEFIMVHAAYTTHLATDCLFAPESRLNDGIIYLVIIRAGCSRSQLLQFLLGMSTGTHIPCTPNENIQVIPVSAFRIEPSGDDGIMVVDGERVDYGSIQAEIFPGMINVMVPNATSS